MPRQDVRGPAHKGKFGMPKQPVGQFVRNLWQTKSVKPLLIAESAAAGLVKCCHSAAPIRMATIRLRLAAEMTRYVGNECVCFVDAVINFSRQFVGMKEQRMTCILAVDTCCPSTQALGEWYYFDRTRTQEFRFVSTSLHLDHEILIG